VTTELESNAGGHQATAPIGHHGTRAAVLLQLKRVGAATAAPLAAALGCSLNAIRHHLRELEADGTVTHERARHGVGAPAHTYRLTPKGHALFPERYAGTVARLLDHLVVLQGREASARLLQEYYGVIGERIRSEAEPLAVTERGEQIARALDHEGFMATWQALPDGGVLTEHNCPHRVVAEQFPEVCAAEEAFLAAAFGGSVQRQSHIAAGCGSCSYHVTLAGPTTGDAS
jgi:DeoR family suf operon transcriptional repressor